MCVRGAGGDSMSMDPGIVAGESPEFEASQGSYIVRPYFKKKKSIEL